MHTVTLKSRVGPDGVLRLELPVGMRDVDLDVVVVVNPATAADAWPPEFFSQVVGSIDDPTFIRPPQGEPETREPME
jgi:hypothetical protein